jgi:hypothetical protein
MFMALDQTGLKNAIKAAFKSVENIKDPPTQQETLAQKLAEAIHTYVTAGKVKTVAVDLTTGAQNNNAPLE